MIDPYHLWLGIPPQSQPADHYRLLGLRLFEDDLEVIRDAAERQMAHVRRYLNGKHHDAALAVCLQIEQATRCLLQQEEKERYDDQLRSGDPLEVDASQLLSNSADRSMPHDETTDFDPYYRWLGIGPDEQPADHYRLLGVERHEDDPQVIREATERQMAHIRRYTLGSNAEIASRLLLELARAKSALLSDDLHVASSSDNSVQPRPVDLRNHQAEPELPPPELLSARA